MAAGLDLWITHTATNSSASIQLDIPANFFGGNSDALSQIKIPLAGEALPTQTGTPPLDRADTIVQRLGSASLSTCGPGKQVDLKIVALRLHGVEPIRVTHEGGGSPELWTVRACLSSAPQETGSLTIRQQCAAGGSFDSVVKVRPKLVFRKQDGNGNPVGNPVVMDWGEYSELEEITFRSTGKWAHQAPGGFQRITAAAGVVTDGDCDGTWDAALPTGSTDNFIVGLDPGPSCSCFPTGQVARDGYIEDPVTHHQAPLHFHLVDPASLDSRGFRLNRDRRKETPEESDHPGKTRAFVVLGIGAFFATLLPWRKRRTGPKD